MPPKDYSRFLPLALSAILLTAGLTGCGAHDRIGQAPAGTHLGQPLTAAQVQAIQQKRQGAMQQHALGQ